MINGPFGTRYAALVSSLVLSSVGTLLDDITTFVGLARGFVETNPIYPYSLLIIPAFWVSFLLLLDYVRKRTIPRRYNGYFIAFMLAVAAIAFRGFINNMLVFNGWLA